MPDKNNKVKQNLVHDTNKLSGWDDLIALGKRHILAARVREEELAAAIRVFEERRDAGDPWPGEERHVQA